MLHLNQSGKWKEENVPKLQLTAREIPGKEFCSLCEGKKPGKIKELSVSTSILVFINTPFFRLVFAMSYLRAGVTKHGKEKWKGASIPR